RRAARHGRRFGWPIRPLERRPARDAPSRRRCPTPTRRARRRLRGARELLGRARRWPRVSALHAAGRVPRLGRGRRAPCGRPGGERSVAPRPRRRSRCVSDWGSWEHPQPTDEPSQEEKPYTPPHPDEGDYGWGDYPEWPVTSPSSEYPAYGELPT